MPLGRGNVCSNKAEGKRFGRLVEGKRMPTTKRIELSLYSLASKCRVVHGEEKYKRGSKRDIIIIIITGVLCCNLPKCALCIVLLGFTTLTKTE